jgi:hypothetical protein
MDRLRHWWADTLTWQHQRFLARRDLSPWYYCIPIAVVTAFLVG